MEAQKMISLQDIKSKAEEIGDNLSQRMRKVDTRSAAVAGAVGLGLFVLAFLAGRRSVR